MPLSKSVPYKFIVLALLFFTADFVITNINHRFNLFDFKVYYGAAGALINGKQVYGVIFCLGSGYYKYSPFTALLATPFLMFPYYIAGVMQFICIATATICTCIILLHLLNNYVFLAGIKRSNLLLSLSLLCIALHLERESGLGNINMLLLFLLCLSIHLITRDKLILPGILLAIIIITKPFFILVIIPLALRRYYKTIITFTVSLISFILLPALILGFNKDIALHKEWLKIMLAHAAGFPSPNTLDAIIRNHISYPINPHFQYLVIVLLLVPFIVITYRDITDARKNEKLKMQGLIMESFILFALIPSMFKTDTEQFLTSLPLIMFILYYLFLNKGGFLTGVFIFLIILYEGNSSDLLGNELSAKVNDWGILGISNLLIVALAIYLYIKVPDKKSHSIRAVC